MSRNLAPDTNNLSSHQSRIGNTIQQVRGSMPMHALFDFSYEGVADAREVRILPRASGGFGGAISVPFRLFDLADSDFTESSNHAHTEMSEWRLDLNDSSIDLVNRKSGLIDGVTFDADQYGQTWLVWALLDKFLNFTGFGLSRKPFATFSAIGGDGTAAKGEAGVAFTVPGYATASQFTGYNFTVGARVVVRNAVGTSPLYEWNWGIVTAVSNTTITLTMDNVAAYGMAITGVTTGEILQWNMFRPWVLSASGQTLYGTDSYFNLIGEIYTIISSGNISKAYRSSDEWRWIPQVIFHDESGTAASATTSFSLARFIPLWADAIEAFALVVPGTAGDSLVLSNTNTGAQQILSVGSVNGVSNYEGGIGQLSEFSTITTTRTRAVTATTGAAANGVYIFGGMRS